MRRFLTPGWIVSHVFVASMVVLMMNLGFWQLNRLDERRDRNDEVRLVRESPAVDLAVLLDSDADLPERRPVVAAGEYLADDAFLVANRTFDSQAGSWLAVPMRLDDGRIVVVSRGWVPRLWAAGDDPRDAGPPPGRVEVLGRIFASVDGGRIGTDDIAILPEISRLDLDAVEELTGLDTVDVWIQLEREAPPVDDLPIPVPRVGLDEGPHLSYAFQWFFFSTGTVVAYVLILRRRAGEADDDAAPAVDVPDHVPADW